jgi:DNA-binding ferritin-like protein
MTYIKVHSADTLATIAGSWFKNEMRVHGHQWKMSDEEWLNLHQLVDELENSINGLNK